MCGSGTLILEGLTLFQPVFDRPFSFLSWKHTPKIFKSPVWKKNYRLLAPNSPFKLYRGFDLDEKVIGAAEQNTKDLLTQTGMPAPDIAFSVQNLFSESGQIKVSGPCWCVCNPPYGERLRVQGQKEFSYQNMLAQMIQNFSPQKLAILLPEKEAVRSLAVPSGYKSVASPTFSNGGLDVIFLVYEKVRT
ncbi:MAG: hypothetical protein EOP06_20470, partial [Proteobacteria bacterium]